MGITIVQKSDLSQKKTKAKRALVLAGGALTGAAFKIGGLKAFNDYFVDFDIRNFNIFLGISSGSLLATAISGGLSPEEMLKSLDGTSKKFSQLQPWHFYWPNLEEFLKRPFRYWGRALTSVLGRHPFPSLLEWLPSGVFDNAPLEKYLRDNIRKNKMTNDFRLAKKMSGKSLYITAMTLDGAQEEVFGFDEKNDVTISKAVQASSAMPGFYKPVKIGDQYYVDGGVKHTANLDLIIEKGAKLIICYNPFRPYEQKNFAQELGGRTDKKVHSLTEEGVFAVLNQFFRTVFHTRLHNALHSYQNNPDFDGDIILIEPRADDSAFFSMNPFAMGQRLHAAQLGFESVRNSIEEQYDTIAPILASYGISMSRKGVEEEYRRIHGEPGDSFLLQKILETGRGSKAKRKRG